MNDLRHPATGNYPHPQQLQNQQHQQRDTLRRGRSLLAREEGDVSESGLNIFRRAQTLRRKKSAAAAAAAPPPPPPKKNRGCWKGPGPGGPWMTFCLIITFWMPNFLLSACGALWQHLERQFHHSCLPTFPPRVIRYQHSGAAASMAGEDWPRLSHPG